MPCTDGGPSYAQVERERRDETERKRQCALRDAQLCAVLTVLESEGRFETVLAAIDTKEAGITRHELRAWWDKHKREDAERREKEAAIQARADARRMAAEERARLRTAALAKLTPDERAALEEA